MQLLILCLLPAYFMGIFAMFYKGMIFLFKINEDQENTTIGVSVLSLFLSVGQMIFIISMLFSYKYL